MILCSWAYFFEQVGFGSLGKDFDFRIGVWGIF